MLALVTVRAYFAKTPRDLAVAAQQVFAGHPFLPRGAARGDDVGRSVERLRDIGGPGHLGARVGAVVDLLGRTLEPGSEIEEVKVSSGSVSPVRRTRKRSPAAASVVR